MPAHGLFMFQERAMAVKKPASKSRKASKTPSRPAARKGRAHRVEPRRPAVAERRVAGRDSKESKKAPVPNVIELKKPLLRPVPPPAKPATGAAPGRSGTPEQDDGDGVEPGSLLAGPRNVKPYIAKRGEQYMGKEQLRHFQRILASWKRDLMEEVDRTVTHMKDEAANFPDPNDRATQEEEFSLELRTRDRERKLIRKIDEALKRIEDGSYGYCLETGEEIGIKRLEARPVATLSIEAQERRERRERQYGERDDRYR
jgi:DnaK suppressor protein